MSLLPPKVLILCDVIRPGVPVVCAAGSFGFGAAPSFEVRGYSTDRGKPILLELVKEKEESAGQISPQVVTMPAHKVILAACSPYFRAMLKKNPAKHPVLIMPG